MQYSSSKKFIGAVFVAALVLSACVLPEKNDPFERLPKEEVETLSGEIFPFSVSVSTKITHRLEANNRLVAYLTSDIVRLNDFVGRKVEIDGVRRKEKMREIFWVEAVRVKDLEAETEQLTLAPRFSNETITFPYNENWVFSTSPEGGTYFTEKDDVEGRVFLQFSTEIISPNDETVDPNVLISNLAGTKEVKIDPSDKERQEIILLSNLFPDQKYKFIFTADQDDFTKKKSFQKLLNQIVEGRENVQKIIDEEKKQLADFEAEKVAAEKVKQEELEALAKAQEEADKSTEEAKNAAEGDEESLIGKLFDNEKESEKNETETTDTTPAEITTEPENTTEKEPEAETVTTADLPNDYKNLIDDRAYSYESTYYGFSMKSPFGLWFENFGASENRITSIGFAKHEIEGKSSTDFLLEVIGDENPPTEFSETVKNNELIIKWPRNNKSFFQLSGKPEFRDYMRSLQGTVKSF